jgi:hypothetical protein
MVRNNYLQQRIKLIAGKSLTYESLNGLSWFVFYWRCIKCKGDHSLKMAVEQSRYLRSDKTTKTCSFAPSALAEI